MTRTGRPRRDDIWQQTLAEVDAWVAAHGKLPSAGSSDMNTRRLGAWLATNRKTAPDDRRATLDAVLPGWDKRGPEHTWDRQLTRARAWFDRNPGAHPNSNATAAEERAIYDWLEFQRRPGTDPARIVRLDSVIPGWRGMTQDETWRAHLDSLKAWVAEHGTFPPQRLKPEGEWLHVQRRPTIKPERAAILDAELPGWR